MTDGRMIWLDFETTGFPELHSRGVYSHAILEIGLGVTDEHYNLVETKSLVIGHQFKDIQHLLDEVVEKMHNTNGLFAACAASQLTLKEAEAEAIAFYRSHGVKEKQCLLSGNGITFDRIFMDAQMPELSNFFHYRQNDISTVKEFLKPIFPGIEPPKNRPHRAVPDVLESISEAKHYYDFLRGLALRNPEYIAGLSLNT